MNDNKLPKVFWTIAIIAIVWNLLGVTAYVMEATMSEAAFTALPEAQQALYDARPAWVTGAFAIAVFGGLAGSILLAMRKQLATPVFVVSLLGVVAQNSYFFVLSDTMSVMGPSSAAMPSLVLLIAVGLVWFSAHANNRSWIN